MIDLHLHSTNSDGNETPARLVRSGMSVGLSAMALTDHDTMDGAEDFLEACRSANMTGIAGIELSADTGERSGTLHILGYGLDPSHPEVEENLTRVQEARNWRNEQILERLHDLGLELEWQEVEDCACEDVIGRVHFAQALMNRDYVFSIEEAFEKYLSKDAPAYVSRYHLLPEECIRMIRAAGGAAVIAHPVTWEDDPETLEKELRKLKDSGLYGIEVVHPLISYEEVILLMRLAKRIGLQMTGGSDFHGTSKPDVRMGRGFGGAEISDVYLDPLLAEIDGTRNPQVFVRKR